MAHVVVADGVGEGLVIEAVDVEVENAGNVDVAAAEWLEAQGEAGFWDEVKDVVAFFDVAEGPDVLAVEGSV